MELRTERLLLRPRARRGSRSPADCFERVGLERVYAGVDPENEKSLRVLAKAPGVRKVDEELYELTAAAFVARLVG